VGRRLAARTTAFALPLSFDAWVSLFASILNLGKSLSPWSSCLSLFAFPVAVIVAVLSPKDRLYITRFDFNVNLSFPISRVQTGPTLRLSGFNNVSLVNFGQPRVGNPQFVSKFQQMVPYYYRVVNKADPVPNIPPREFGYVHGAVQLWYPHDGYSFRVCNGGEDPTCSDSLYPWDWRPRDHTQYLAINQAIQNGHGCCGWPCAPGPVVLL